MPDDRRRQLARHALVEQDFQAASGGTWRSATSSSAVACSRATLGTLQSLLALTFAFLFALALRRRFQIS